MIYYYLSILIELPKHTTLPLPKPDEYEFRKVYKIQVYFFLDFEDGKIAMISNLNFSNRSLTY